MRVRGKNVYFDHRRFLPMTHPMRQSRKFNGKVEKRPPPRRWTTKDILRQISLLSVTLPGKRMSFGHQKKTVDWLKTFNCRKKSVLLELEYWPSLVLRHNLDVMHVEKSMCDSLLHTILGMDKSEDTENTRKDLADMKIRPKLHLFTQGEKLMKPTVDFTLTPEECR